MEACLDGENHGIVPITSLYGDIKESISSFIELEDGFHPNWSGNQTVALFGIKKIETGGKNSHGSART